MVSPSQNLTTGLASSHALHVVIHRELVGMRTKTQRVVFLLFHLQPVRDKVGVEDVALEKERVVGFQRFNGAAQGIRNAWHVREFFRRQLVEILIERVARIDPVLDSVQSSEETGPRRQDKDLLLRQACGTRFV